MCSSCSSLGLAAAFVSVGFREVLGIKALIIVLEYTPTATALRHVGRCVDMQHSWRGLAAEPYYVVAGTLA